MPQPLRLPPKPMKAKKKRSKNKKRAAQNELNPKKNKKRAAKNKSKTKRSKKGRSKKNKKKVAQNEGETTGSDTDTETELETETEIESDSDIDTDTEIELETELEFKTDIEFDTDRETDTDTETEIDIINPDELKKSVLPPKQQKPEESEILDKPNSASIKPSQYDLENGNPSSISALVRSLLKPGCLYEDSSDDGPKIVELKSKSDDSEEIHQPSRPSVKSSKCNSKNTKPSSKLSCNKNVLSSLSKCALANSIKNKPLHWGKKFSQEFIAKKNERDAFLKYAWLRHSIPGVTLNYASNEPADVHSLYIPGETGLIPFKNKAYTRIMRGCRRYDFIEDKLRTELAEKHERLKMLGQNSIRHPDGRSMRQYLQKYNKHF